MDVNKKSIQQTLPTFNYFSCQSFPRILVLRGDKLLVQSNKHFSLIKRQTLISCSDNIACQRATVTKKNKAAFKLGRPWIFCDLTKLYHQQTLEKNTGLTRVHQQPVLIPGQALSGFLAPGKHLCTIKALTWNTHPYPWQKDSEESNNLKNTEVKTKK